MTEEIKLADIKKYLNDPYFISIEGYKNLFGLQVYKSGRKHFKEEHVYYCYTPNNFDYSTYKNFHKEIKSYESKKGWEFRKTYNLSRYEIFGNYYFYQLSESKDWKVNFTKFEWLRTELDNYE